MGINYSHIPTGEFIAPADTPAEFHLEAPIAELRGVHNIIFDLGGVVITLNRDKAVKALQDLGLKDADRMLDLYRQEGPFLGLETGRLTAAEFFDQIRSKCKETSGVEPTDAEIQDAFNEFLIGIPVVRLQRLRELRSKGFRIYALSNTNPVMYNSWIVNAFRQEGLSIHDYFDGVVASFEELTCKPDHKIFHIVMHRYNLSPESTLMLDDGPANCEAARSVGMKAIRVGLTEKDDMLAITQDLLNLAKS